MNKKVAMCVSIRHPIHKSNKVNKGKQMSSDKKLGLKIARNVKRASKGIKDGQKRANKGSRKAAKLNLKKEY